MVFLLKGFLIGFAVAAPVGPVGLLTIRRSIVHGKMMGFITGTGAALADAVFGAVAAFGIRAVTDFLTHPANAFELIGGALMIVLGVQAARSLPPAESKVSTETPNLLGAFGSTLVITLTNPMTILGFIAIFSGLKQHPYNSLTAVELTLGVFLGSVAWWLLLSHLATWLGNQLNGRGMRWINACAGLGVALLGVWQLARLASNATR